MNRHFHIVDYATPMEDELNRSHFLDSSFVISSKFAGSEAITGFQLYTESFKYWDFELQHEELDGVIVQKFPELDPVFDMGKFHLIIYPDIKILTPVGFHLHFDSLIPGIGVKNVLMQKGFGRAFDGETKYYVTGSGWTKLYAGVETYHLHIIDRIEFEIIDPRFIECTPEGIMMLKDEYPETNILDITFQCLHKEPHLNYEDLPTDDPMLGCNPKSPYEWAYRELSVFRNATLFDLFTF